MAISFHATKCFATGEGGCAVATDTDWILRIGQALNFGFQMTRESRSAGINGKMSEYHAAVGLASLMAGPRSGSPWRPSRTSTAAGWETPACRAPRRHPGHRRELHHLPLR